MRVKEWPVAERPREKLQLQGAQFLSDAELLAVLLGSGRQGQDVVTFARKLLHHFNGIGPLLVASREQLLECDGIGPARVNQLQVVMELSRRYLKWQLERTDGFTEPSLVKDFLTSKLRHQCRELFVILLLDSQHRLLRYEELFQGTINAAPVYPREVIKLVMKHNAAAVILAHNLIASFFVDVLIRRTFGIWCFFANLLLLSMSTKQALSISYSFHFVYYHHIS